MNASPEQQLRAYIDYFRDLGVFELYRQEQAKVLVPERWRELLATAQAPQQARAASTPAAAPVGRPVQRTTPTAASPRPTAPLPVAPPPTVVRAEEPESPQEL